MRGGHLQHINVKHFTLRAILIVQILCMFKQALTLPALPRRSADHCKAHNSITFPPLLKSKEHVASHDEKQLAVRVFRFELPQGIHGVARPLAFELPVGYNETLMPMCRKPAHGKAMLPGGRMHLLVGRDIGGYQQHPVKMQQPRRLHGKIDMPIMDGVKRAAKHGNLFHSPSHPI